MATRAIKPKRGDSGPGRTWPTLPERAPSIVRAQTPTTARVIGLIGLLLVAMGALGMLAPRMGLTYFIGGGVGSFFGALGVGGLLFHAFNESDQQFRRLYAGLGFVLFCAGVLLRLIPAQGVMGGYFLAYGVPCLFLALGFLGSVARHETDVFLRSRIHALIGLAGAVMVLAGFFFSQTAPAFLTGEGTVLILSGLVFVCAFIAMQEPGNSIGHFAGLALGAVAVVNLVVALIRSGILGWLLPIGQSGYFIPNGLLLIGLSLIYLMVSLAICSEWKLVILTRRELAAFFYSPVAYMLILGMVLVGWWTHYIFVSSTRSPRNQGMMIEPIVAQYILDFVPIFALIFFPALITMRLLSEEQRSGTLEQLLTTPVNDSTIVLSKFFAALLFYFITFIPWVVFFVAFRIMGQSPFDYRPLLSFFLALAATGAGFLAMGLFFSSITRNQIIAAVLSFAVVLILTGLFFFGRTQDIPAPVADLITYGSHLNLWIDTLMGQFAPRRLMFHLSMAVFFLFLTTKVLESRKWR